MIKNFDLTGKTILITGGTGSFGQKCTEILLRDYKPAALRIFSRDELKQFEMRQKFKDASNLRFLLGDIRDASRVERALHGVDVVIHAAALKQVPTLEYNPLEAIKTNILGAENLINGAIDQNVERFVALSTDKAVNPINLYGATKLCMEKLFISGNSYTGKDSTRFSVVRYGNVVGSRGSVIPFFKEKRKSGVLPITDKRMTRFWLTLEQGVDVVVNAVETMLGAEIYVPKIPSMKVIDLAKAIGPECKQEVVGIRPGEKLHEVLLTEDEAQHTLEFPKTYVIQPNHPVWRQSGEPHKDGKRVHPEFRYDSLNNTEWLSEEDLQKLVGMSAEPVRESVH